MTINFLISLVHYWPTKGLIKTLDMINGGRMRFPSFPLCEPQFLRTVRMYEYDTDFVGKDVKQIALYQMRFAGVQQEAQKAAELGRIMLIKDTQKAKVKQERRAQKHAKKHPPGEVSNQEMEETKEPKKHKPKKLPD